MLNDFALAAAARNELEATHLHELEGRGMREASRLANESLERINADIAGVAAA